MVKHALLMSKRRPFTLQKMPFYKPICNYLIMYMLQSDKKIDFPYFVILCSFQTVRLLYHL